MAGRRGLGTNTWMDDCGRGGIGQRARERREVVEVVTPTSVGYLPCGKMLFAHERGHLGATDASP